MNVTRAHPHWPVAAAWYERETNLQAWRAPKRIALILQRADEWGFSWAWLVYTFDPQAKLPFRLEQSRVGLWSRLRTREGLDLLGVMIGQTKTRSNVMRVGPPKRRFYLEERWWLVPTELPSSRPA